MIVTCHCFFHPGKKLRSGAIVRFSDNSSLMSISICTNEFHYYDHITCIYSPRAGTDELLGSILFSE